MPHSSLPCRATLAALSSALSLSPDGRRLAAGGLAAELDDERQHSLRHLDCDESSILAVFFNARFLEFRGSVVPGSVRFRSVNRPSFPGECRALRRAAAVRKAAHLQGYSAHDRARTFCLPCRRSWVRIPSAASPDQALQSLRPRLEGPAGCGRQEGFPAGYPLGTQSFAPGVGHEGLLDRAAEHPFQRSRCVQVLDLGFEYVADRRVRVSVDRHRLAADQRRHGRGVRSAVGCSSTSVPNVPAGNYRISVTVAYGPGTYRLAVRGS
jgi:hypothetical protein